MTRDPVSKGPPRQPACPKCGQRVDITTLVCPRCNTPLVGG